MLETHEESSDSTHLIKTDNMDIALAHARMAFGLNWVAADKDTRVYAYAHTPKLYENQMWNRTKGNVMVHIGYYTGKQSWRKSKRGVV